MKADAGKDLANHEANLGTGVRKDGSGSLRDIFVCRRVTETTESRSDNENNST